ncbi:MAG: hypothetical protein ABI852_14965, partial [Gemmatimonadaceae bacterium]
LLHSGQASAVIDKDGFSVSVPIVAGRALMVVNPDTIKTAVKDLQTGLRIAKAYVYNRGSVNLIWSVKSVDTSFTKSPCIGIRGNFCGTAPAVGIVDTLKPNAMDSVLFAFTDQIGGLPLFNSRLFSFVLTSAEGDVTVRWRWVFP